MQEAKKLARWNFFDKFKFFIAEFFFHEKGSKDQTANLDSNLLGPEFIILRHAFLIPQIWYQKSDLLINFTFFTFKAFKAFGSFGWINNFIDCLLQFYWHQLQFSTPIRSFTDLWLFWSFIFTRLHGAVKSFDSKDSIYCKVYQINEKAI